MVELLQADEPVDELGDALAAAVLQRARELLLGQRHRHFLRRDRVTQGELQRRDRVCVRIGLACEEGDDAWAFLEGQKGTNWFKLGAQ